VKDLKSLEEARFFAGLSMTYEKIEAEQQLLTKLTTHHTKMFRDCIADPGRAGFSDLFWGRGL
jgi:hypothetical protein